MGGGEINLQIGHPRELIIVLSGNFVACVFLRRRTTNTISSEEGEGSILIRAKLIHSGSLVAANSVSCRTGSVRPLSSAIRRQRYSITADQPWHQSCKAPLFRCRLSTIDWPQLCTERIVICFASDYVLLNVVNHPGLAYMAVYIVTGPHAACVDQLAFCDDVGL